MTSFHQRVGQQQAPQARQVPPCPPGAQRQAAHEDDQHQRLRVGGMAEKQLQVVRPDRLVDQPGRTGEREQAIQRGERQAVFHPGGSETGRDAVCRGTGRADHRPLAARRAGRRPLTASPRHGGGPRSVHRRRPREHDLPCAPGNPQSRRFAAAGRDEAFAGRTSPRTRLTRDTRWG